MTVSPEVLAERIDSLVGDADVAWSQAEREARLHPLLADLTAWHRLSCDPYDRMMSLLWGAAAEVPAVDMWLPVATFKEHDLLSVARSEVVKVLTSSGTTGQVPSRIHLDRATARRQTKALAAVMTRLLGPRRRPMLIVDSRSVVRDPRSYSARGAGILGMATFGRDHTYVLDDDGLVDRGAVEAFAQRHPDEDVLVFGFTFMVWEHLLEACEGLVDLSRAVLVHSGGWKALQARAIGDTEFKEKAARSLGIRTVRNFYGMVEQVGGVFLEGDDGLLHPPPFADVIVRDPVTWRPQPVGRQGVVQVISPLPTSYPGHCLLTEDLGTIVSVDDPGSGLGGKGLVLQGRVPRTELRGCSDTHARRAGAV